MSGAREQVQRLLALTPYLRAREEGVSLRQVAADFGVKPAQIVRDLKVLWMCGLPGYGPDDLVDIDFEPFENDPDGTVKVSNAAFLPRPLRLDSTEATALAVALRALREGSDEATRPLVEQVLATIEQASGEAARAAVEVHLPAPEAAPELTGTLHGAIEEDRQLRLDYFVPARDETTERVVDPIAVLSRDGHDYLDAWCHRAEDRRLFRVDRIDRAEALDTARDSELIGDLRPRDLAEDLFTPGPDAERVVLRLAPGARWLAEYYPTESEDEGPEGALDVTLLVADPRWLVQLVLGAAPDVAVVEPASYAEKVAAAARAALEGYGRGVA